MTNIEKLLKEAKLSDIEVELDDKETLKDKFETWLDEKAPKWIDDTYYFIYRNTRWIRDLPKNIKYFFQRLFRGYSTSDLWDLNDHLSDIIYKRLVAYKKMERMGYPGGDGMTPEKWEDMLDKMIWSFDFIKNGDITDDKIWEEITKNESYNKNVSDKYFKRYQEGMDLFAKYFMSLWD